MKIIETNLNFVGTLKKRSKTNKVIGHHADAFVCTIEDIERWHKAKGWAGVGYHFFIRKDGTIYRGRPIDTIGAHCEGQNSDSIGICFEGRFTQENPTNEQISSAKRLIAMIKNVYGNIPVDGHKKFKATDCPGSLMNYLDELNGVIQTPVQAEVPAAPQGNQRIKGIQELCNVLRCTDKNGNSLKVDGISGPLTESAVAKLPIIKQNSNCDQAVRVIQDIVGTKVDGDFGPKTLAAVKAYQTQNGLVADGIVGPKTWKKLLAL